MIKEIDKLEKEKSILLHSCCAPCSSYVLEYFKNYFGMNLVTVFFYNPNITKRQEYEKRRDEQKRLCERLLGAPATNLPPALRPNGLSAESATSLEGGLWLLQEKCCRNTEQPLGFIEGDYDPARFKEIAKGFESYPEGGERCFRCYELRLRETARIAGELGYDYFATTLTLSPLKNADKINEIGSRASLESKTLSTNKSGKALYLPSDFKKKGGYQRSIELSKQYSLYRQNFCGCAYSQNKLLFTASRKQ